MLTFARQDNQKTEPRWCFRININCPPVCLNEAVDDRQAKTSAMCLRCKKLVEGLAMRLDAEPGTVVLNSDTQARVTVHALV